LPLALFAYPHRVSTETIPGPHLMEAVGYFAKKLVSTFCYPLSFSLLVLFVGIILWRARRRPRAGFALTLTAAMLLVVVSFPVTGYVLTKALETEAGPYADPSELKRRGVKYIVVLGAELVTAERTPADRMGNSLFRVMEGIRLWRGIEDGVLVLSGGSMPGTSSEAEAMAALPMELGVPRKALVLETGAWDTEGEARIFSRLVGKEPFALVTSALHIPRAMRHFQSLGLNPIACPCEFKIARPLLRYQWFWPNADALLRSQMAIHEYLGRAWLTLKLLFRPSQLPIKAGLCSPTAGFCAIEHSL